MVMKPDALKLGFALDPIGQGFYEDFSMSYVLNVRGIEVIVFMHELTMYVMLPLDFEERGIVVRAEKDILQELREELGYEIKSVILCTPNVH
jgi:hypothetical protein